MSWLCYIPVNICSGGRWGSFGHGDVSGKQDGGNDHLHIPKTAMSLSKPIKDSNIRNLIESLLSLSVLQGFVYIFPVIILGYLSEVIGVANIGAIAFAQSTVNYFLSFVDYGLKLNGTREVALNKNDPERLSKVFSTIVWIKTLLLLVSLVIVALLVMIVPPLRDKALLIFFSLGVLVGDVLVPVWFFQGMERMRYVTIMNIVTQTVFLVAVFLLVKQESHYIYVPLLGSLGYILSGVLSIFLVFARFNVRLVRVSWRELWDFLKAGWSVFLTDFLPNLYNNSTEFMLGLFASDMALGFYAVAKKVVDAFNQVSYVISRAYFPLLNRDFSYFKAFRRVIFAAGALLSLLLLVSADYMVYLLPSDKLAGASELIRIMSISPLLMATMLCYGTNYLLVKRQDALYMRITLFVSVLGFLAGLVLIPLYDQYGASVTLVMSRALLAGMGFWAYWRHRQRSAG